MSAPFTACIVQTLSLPYEKEENLRRALTAMETAHAQGASLILFPEMFLTGYLIKDRLAELTEDLAQGQALARLREKAKALSMGVVMGMPVANPDGGKPYNSIVMIDRDGSIAGVSHKTHFFGGEEKMFTAGQELKAFDTSFGRMGILVCYDGEFPETARTLALDGAKLLCMCSANMTPYEDYHPVYMRARAMENCAYTLYVNYVGTEKRFRYCGQSSAFHPTGRILAQADTQEETMLFVPVDMADTTSPDAFLNYLNFRRPELYHASLK
ncbi:MAG: carbon-nitrogen hydrolase family protein [Evtepia sp.]|uniref:carbon-nitrogen hydrolase family protein n=1 Tax=Evtepia sp. TaxID=2773933 RepID=UPI002A751CCD|nr:carbon-nitrogen hydrolase family protein [Evtepia sp.]MDY3014684.1 carbon-nitrogen hydrolase family protein [Evtepia sp.]